MTLQKRALLPNTDQTSQQRDFIFSNNYFCHYNSSTLFNIRTASTMSVFPDFKFELNLYLSLGLLQSNQLALRTFFKSTLERLL